MGSRSACSARLPSQPSTARPDPSKGGPATRSTTNPLLTPPTLLPYRPDAPRRRRRAARRASRRWWPPAVPSSRRWWGTGWRSRTASARGWPMLVGRGLGGVEGGVAQGRMCAGPAGLECSSRATGACAGQGGSRGAARESRPASQAQPRGRASKRAGEHRLASF